VEKRRACRLFCFENAKFSALMAKLAEGAIAFPPYGSDGDKLGFQSHNGYYLD
jgi:hypothetical protein